MVVKTCLSCKKKFEVINSKKNRAKFCSWKCKLHFGRSKDKICVYCKKKFKVIKSRENAAKFCSRKCNYENLKGKPSLKYNPIAKICEFCEKRFITIKARENTAKFCSLKCKYMASRGKKPWNYNALEIECLICKKRFNVQQYRKNNAKFCSRKCRTEYGLVREKVCRICNKVFTVVKSVNEKFNRPYCSMKCYNLERCIKIRKACKFCGNEFIISRWENFQEFCSTDCVAKWRKNRKKNRRSWFFAKLLNISKYLKHR